MYCNVRVQIYEITCLTSADKDRRMMLMEHGINNIIRN